MYSRRCSAPTRSASARSSPSRSRLSWTGSQWVKLDLVRGLPRSEENHAPNGMHLDDANQILRLGPDYGLLVIDLQYQQRV